MKVGIAAVVGYLFYYLKEFVTARRIREERARQTEDGPFVDEIAEDEEEEEENDEEDDEEGEGEGDGEEEEDYEEGDGEEVSDDEGH